MKKIVLVPSYVPTDVDFEGLNFVTQEAKTPRTGARKTKTVDDDEIQKSGLVIHSHEAQLWALWIWNSKSLEEGMLMLLPLGSDAGSVCVICEQLVRAFYGIDAIPEQWLNALQQKDILEKALDKLVKNTLTPRN